MNFINDLTNIKSLCRICLTQSKNIIPLNTKMGDLEKDPRIIEALEEVASATIFSYEGYPTVICPMCLGLLKISYNLKIQFKNTEKVLLQHFQKTLDPLLLDHTENSKANPEPEVTSNEPSPVEIVVGTNKYDLKDILIVEDEKSDQEYFKGFLDNLGKSISAKFINKSKKSMKNLLEEEPVVHIEKLEPQTKNTATHKAKSLIKSNFEFLDQYIIFHDNEKFFENSTDTISKTNPNLEKIGLENITSAAQELLQNVSNMQVRCDICDNVYSSKLTFRRHLGSCKKLQSQVVKNYKNSEVVILKCHLCPRTFKQIKFLNYHVKTTHNIEPLKYKCDICGEISRNRNILMYHKLTKHGERRFACELCSKKFFTSNGLKTHIQSHTERNVAQCICPVCGKTFHYKGGLFYHMKLHTNERKYCCEFCDKKFYTLNAKKRHTLTHTGIRPYACKCCSKRFFSAGELRKHEYVHSGVRPYYCQYCKKGFSSSYNMKVHLVSHPGPYACKYCDKTFVNMNVLQYHFRTKHSLSEESDNNLELNNTQSNQISEVEIGF